MAQKTRVLPAQRGKVLNNALKKAGWRRVETPDAFEGADVESVWRNDVADAFVAWVDDEDVAEHFYGLVFGPGWEAGAASLRGTGLMIDARTGIGTIQHAETVAEIGSAARALGLLAVGPYDPEVHKVLAGLLAIDNVDLQFDALTGVSLCAWPQLQEALEALIAAPGTDADVRADAEAILDEQIDCDWNVELR